VGSHCLASPPLGADRVSPSPLHVVERGQAERSEAGGEATASVARVTDDLFTHPERADGASIPLRSQETLQIAGGALGEGALALALAARGRGERWHDPEVGLHRLEILRIGVGHVVAQRA